MVLNKQHEAKRIDNKEYEKVVVQDGKVLHKQSAKGKKRPYLLASLFWCWLGQEEHFGFSVLNNMRYRGTLLEPVAEKMPNLSSRTETQVVIMMNGDTYYAKKVENDGSLIRITTKNGAVVEVAEKNVLDITTAVIEE